MANIVLGHASGNAPAGQALYGPVAPNVASKPTGATGVLAWCWGNGSTVRVGTSQPVTVGGLNVPFHSGQAYVNGEQMHGGWYYLNDLTGISGENITWDPYQSNPGALISVFWITGDLIDLDLGSVVPGRYGGAYWTYTQTDPNAGAEYETLAVLGEFDNNSDVWHRLPAGFTDLRTADPSYYSFGTRYLKERWALHEGLTGNTTYEVEMAVNAGFFAIASVSSGGGAPTRQRRQPIMLSAV